jgi:EAL domain-containing protein (putative c-di-GMP-specific phosphodiesterase class I)
LTIGPIRFLGLAFATADLLFEVDAGGLVTFVAGAVESLGGTTSRALTGQSWQALAAPADRPLGEALIAGVGDGERRGPILVRLAADHQGKPRYAHLSAFRMPGGEGRVSCALALADPPASGRGDGGLWDQAGFESAARELIDSAQARGGELELGLIELGGLGARTAAMDEAEAEALRLKVSGALRAEALGNVAAQLDGDRFAVLRRPGDSPEAMARRLSRVLGASIQPKARTFAVNPFTDPTRTMRALRFALDSFIAKDAAIGEASSLAEILDMSVQETVAKAGSFEALVMARRFDLAYQPVISLTDGLVHHHEVLVRFDGDRSPYAMIRMAEELDIIESLDRAVADEAIKTMRADATGQLRLAVNVSGRTIISPGYVKMIERLTERGDLAGRLMFEVTESAVIEDMERARVHVQALQKRGFRICLDDFGAGAASYGYLQQLRVDVVKIDGAYVREFTGQGRDDAMIRHLAGLCRELKVETIAEMVETEDVADALRRAGVDYAQGWLFGQPNRIPQGLTAPTERVAARRRGIVEQWG